MYKHLTAVPKIHEAKYGIREERSRQIKNNSRRLVQPTFNNGQKKKKIMDRTTIVEINKEIKDVNTIS